MTSGWARARARKARSDLGMRATMPYPEATRQISRYPRGPPGGMARHRGPPGVLEPIALGGLTWAQRHSFSP